MASWKQARRGPYLLVCAARRGFDLLVRTDGLRRSGREEHHERGDDYDGHEEH
jgi:hypothetical protein